MGVMEKLRTAEDVAGEGDGALIQHDCGQTRTAGALPANCITGLRQQVRRAGGRYAVAADGGAVRYWTTTMGPVRSLPMSQVFSYLSVAASKTSISKPAA